MKSLDTIAVHGGEERDARPGDVAAPLHVSTTYLSREGEDYYALRYGRLSNTPTHVPLQRKLAALEGCEAALVTASGMAAISTTLLALLAEGDHILAQENLYGGTHSLFTCDLPELGRRCTFIDPENPRAWSGALEGRTRVLYLESISNPLLRVPDFEALLAFARANGLLTIIDNTFATPINFNPAKLGFDLVVHSATKYLNGHTDVVAGCVMGSESLVGLVRRRLGHLGGSLDSHACGLLDRGLKTLGLRVRAQNANAFGLAQRLSRHPAVARVIHPGLETHPDRERALRYFRGMGGMLSLELNGGAAAAEKMMSRLKLPFIAPSLGGVETLVTRPAMTSHIGMTREAREALGITDGLVRVSVGVEGLEDLAEDFEQALG